MDFGLDPRPAVEIERAAKISAAGGPLYARCSYYTCGEGEGSGGEGGGGGCQGGGRGGKGVGFACGAVEGTPGAFRRCGKCKVAKFCCPEHLRLAWPAHKLVCGTAAYRERRLESEEAVSAAIESLPK